MLLSVKKDIPICFFCIRNPKYIPPVSPHLFYFPTIRLEEDVGERSIRVMESTLEPEEIGGKPGVFSLEMEFIGERQLT